VTWYNIQNDYTWIYCLGHAGVRENENADRLAGKAMVNNVLEIDKSDLQTAIQQQQLQTQESNEFNKGPTTNDLKNFV
jgi:ribonuclease HI